ncbi:MAG: AAA domain-containing protein [Gemmatales bacterium]|nr:hypothetical protein [Gemmatales bacterium]MDW7993394.1 AAA domain-containing protein [Gemmatales bacterium]
MSDSPSVLELAACESAGQAPESKEVPQPVRRDPSETLATVAFLPSWAAWAQFPHFARNDEQPSQPERLASLVHLAKCLLRKDTGELGFDHVLQEVPTPTPEKWPQESRLEWFDPQLTKQQRDLVERALQSSQGFVIQGPPASGKTRVVVEIIRQCLKRSWRVVVSAPNDTALRYLARKLGKLDEYLAVYVPEPTASVADVPEDWRDWLAATRAKDLAARLERDAEAAQSFWQSRSAQLRQVLDWLDEAEHSVTLYAQEDSRLHSLHRAQEQTHAKFRQWLAHPETIDDAELRNALETEKRKHESILADLHERYAAAQRLEQQAHQQWDLWQQRCAEQERIVAVKRARAFWTWLWWRHLFQARSEARWAEFQARLREAANELEHRQTERRQIEESLQRERLRHASTRERIIKAAYEAQCADLEQQIHATQARAAQALDRWHTLRQKLHEAWPALDLPHQPTIEAVRLRREQARTLMETAKQHLQAVEHLRQQLNSLVEIWSQRFADWAQLVLVPAPALLRDPSLRRADWMIVLDAHDLKDSTWEQLCAAAEHWLLCGEPEAVRPGGATSPRAALAAPWEHRDAAPWWMPCRWWQTGAGIACQMTAALVHQPVRSWTEPLADHPEVLLRFSELAQGSRVLAEVFFPAPQYDIRQAKVFLAQQMEELQLSPASLSARWHEDDVRVSVEWSATAGVLPVHYGQGIQEELAACVASDGRTTWRTLRLHFEKSQGWTLAAAQQWLREHSNIAADPRTAWLWCWHGGVAPLGDWPNWVLGLEVREEALSGLLRVPRPAAGSGRPAERSRRRPDTEEAVDLASEQRKRLPIAWQCRLPARGVVYPHAARELMQRLRELLPTVSELAKSWAVVGWWDKPQLELLRWLARDELTDAGQLHWWSIEDCRQQQVEGLLVALDSLQHWSRPVPVEHWLRLGATAQRFVLMLEPDYQKLYRSLNARQMNPLWLSELLGRVSRLPVLASHNVLVATA